MKYLIGAIIGVLAVIAILGGGYTLYAYLSLRAVLKPEPPERSDQP